MNERKDLDGWPSERDQIASVPYIHAFGQVTLSYNMMEIMMGNLFTTCVPMELDFAERLFHKLNNRERIDLLSALVRTNEKESEAREAILHCIRCYDICTDNRNILMHVTLDDLDATAVLLKKRASQDPTRDIIFHVPLTDLRLVADQIGQTFQYTYDLFIWLLRREAHGFHLKGVTTLLGDLATVPPGPLPDRPPKPRKLTPYQPPEADAGTQSPPQPSEA